MPLKIVHVDDSLVYIYVVVSKFYCMSKTFL